MGRNRLDYAAKPRKVKRAKVRGELEGIMQRGWGVLVFGAFKT
jgi:hypothetical protein